MNSKRWVEKCWKGYKRKNRGHKRQCLIPDSNLFKEKLQITTENKCMSLAFASTIELNLANGVLLRAVSIQLHTLC